MSSSAVDASTGESAQPPGSGVVGGSGSGGGGGGGKFQPSPKSAAASQQLRLKKQQQALANTRGVLDYLRLKVPKSTLQQLYIDEQRGPFVCRAVVQQLSDASQQILMRLQCTGGSFPLAGVQVWFCKGAAMLNQVVLPELRQWGMIQEVTPPPNGEDPTSATAAVAQHRDSELTLTPEFQTGFTRSLCLLQASPWPPIDPEEMQEWERLSALHDSSKAGGANTNATSPKKRRAASALTPEAAVMGTVTPEDLERYTQTVWDSVLHFLVGTDHAMEPPAAVIHFLLQTGLMQTDPEYTGPNPETQAPLVITEKGYDFMLQDNYEQVWHFCLQYLQVVSMNKEKEKGERMVRECLLLMICLSFCTTIGQAFLATNLTKKHLRMLRDLAHFGLLYVRELTFDDQGTTKLIFYPTRLSLSLIGPGSASAASAQDKDASLIPASAQWSLSSKALEACLAHPTPHDSSHLAIIVQTNFQICAYTTSELHVSMLALFCDVGTIRRLPNVVFLRMTRDSVKGAFSFGIQARQILRFLEKHSHPKLRAQNKGKGKEALSPIPSNVIDQVWLWDRERTRIQMTMVFQHLCVLEGEFDALYLYSNDVNKHGTPVPHVWSSKGKNLLFFNYDFALKIQNFVRQWRAKAAARQAARGEN